MKDEILIVNILACGIIMSQFQLLSFAYPSAKQPRATQTNDPGLFQESRVYTSNGPDFDPQALILPTLQTTMIL